MQQAFNLAAGNNVVVKGDPMTSITVRGLAAACLAGEVQIMLGDQSVYVNPTAADLTEALHLPIQLQYGEDLVLFNNSDTPVGGAVQYDQQ